MYHVTTDLSYLPQRTAISIARAYQLAIRLTLRHNVVYTMTNVVTGRVYYISPTKVGYAVGRWEETP